MIPAISGYILRVIGTASTAEELDSFVVQEASLPQFSRIIIEAQIDPSEDISSIAQQIEEVCAENYVPYWPEHHGTYTFIEGNTLFIAYMKPAGEVTPAVNWIAIIIGVLLLVPIIMIFAIPGLSEMINSLVMIMIMMMMFNMMKPMLAPASAPATPAVKKEPIEQRISKRIESIAESIERTEKAFKKSTTAGSSALSSVVSDITGVARAIKGAPSSALSGYQKAEAARGIDVLDDKLEKYKKHLSPKQLAKLEEEQRTVEELRGLYG